MDKNKARRIHRRVRELSRTAFTDGALTDVFAWWPAQVKGEVNRQLRARREEVWLAWRSFEAAGSLEATATLVVSLELDVRRLFLVLAIETFDVGLAGHRMHFARADGPEIKPPEWFMALAAVE